MDGFVEIERTTEAQRTQRREEKRGEERGKDKLSC
jgi:hypothetical protein